jgi:hypothetical protein
VCVRKLSLDDEHVRELEMKLQQKLVLWWAHTIKALVDWEFLEFLDTSKSHPCTNTRLHHNRLLN